MSKIRFDHWQQKRPDYTGRQKRFLRPAAMPSDLITVVEHHMAEP
jgi:hypothetical protein